MAAEVCTPQDLSSVADLGSQWCRWVPESRGWRWPRQTPLPARNADRDAEDAWQGPLGSTTEIVAPPRSVKIMLTEPLWVLAVAILGSVIAAAAVTRFLKPISSIAPPPARKPAIFAPFPTPIAGDRTNVVRRAYVRYYPAVLIPIPRLPLSSVHDVSELGQYTSALRDAVGSIRFACDDTHRHVRTQPWEKVLESYVQCVVSSQGARTKTKVVGMFSQGSGILNDKKAKGNFAASSAALDHIAWILFRMRTRTTPAAV